MPKYELSEAAGADFERLFTYGIDCFGVDQALVYAKGMQRRFEEIAENPHHWAAVDFIRAGYRRCVYGQHSIYYHSEADQVTIVKILSMENPEIELL